MTRLTHPLNPLRAALISGAALLAISTPSLSPLRATEARAEGAVEFKIATIAPKGSPWAVLLNKFKGAVSKATGKALAPRVYLDGIKGDEQSIVRQVYEGKLQMGGVSTAALATIAHDMDIIELPYAFTSFEQADRTLDTARPLVEEILAEKGLMLLMYSENGYRSFATQRGCVRKPSDLSAKKMRSQESEAHVETYRALGASPVTLPVSEVISSLQTGVVEGFDNTAIITQALGWDQGIKHFTTSEHIYQPALIVMNKAWFESLSAEHQKAVRESGLALEEKGRKLVRDLGPILLQNFKERGVEVCELTAAERAAFKEATKGVWDLRAQKASPKGLKLLEILRNAGK